MEWDLVHSNDQASNNDCGGKEGKSVSTVAVINYLKFQAFYKNSETCEKAGKCGPHTGKIKTSNRNYL